MTDASKANAAIEAELNSEVGQKRQSAPDRAVEYVLANAVDLFHDQYGNPFVAFENDAVRREIWPLGSKAAAEYIRWCFYQHEGRGLTGEALATARGTLAAKARFQGLRHEMAVRVAQNEGAILYDLGDWRAVRVSSDGWCVVDRPPIVFYHFHHQVAQVEPKPGGSLEPFLDLLNLKDPVGRLLVSVYLVAALLPLFPVPVLVIYGEQGSAKSTFFRLLRALLDPSSLGTLAFPDSLREFVQLAAHHRAVYLDNLSHLPDWLSDALCRLCTGEGSSKRELYSDDEDVVYSFRGLAGINGINLAATKPDLLDRAIILKLEAIPEDKRRTEEDLWEAFGSIRSAALGSIFNVMVAALRRYPDINLQNLPRMADFAKWGVAIAEALGQSGSDFLKAYDVNVVSQNETALEESLVAQALLGLVKEGEFWKGTASDLLTALESKAECLRINTKMKAWPKAPNALSRRLREVIPNLRRVGMVVSDHEQQGVRQWLISRQGGENIATIAATATAKAGSNSKDGQAISLPGPSISLPTGAISLPENPSFESTSSDKGDKGDISPASTACLPSPNGQASPNAPATTLGRKRVTL